jgi:hypothetical protein
MDDVEAMRREAHKATADKEELQRALNSAGFARNALVWSKAEWAEYNAAEAYEYKLYEELSAAETALDAVKK